MIKKTKNEKTRKIQEKKQEARRFEFVPTFFDFEPVGFDFEPVGFEAILADFELLNGVEIIEEDKLSHNE